MRTVRPQPRCMMGLIAPCAVAAGIQRRKRNPNQQRSTKSRPHNNRCHFLSHTKSAKQVRQEPPDRTKRCATCARAARSPDAPCLIAACAVAAGIQRRKRNPNQQKGAPKAGHQIIGVILYIKGYTRDIDIRIRSRKSQITTQTLSTSNQHNNTRAL